MSEDKALGVLDRILSYVDSPFKLIALLLMFVFGFCAWFVYSNQELLVGAYKESQKLPSINEARADDAAAILFKYGGAQTVAIFKVNPLFGTRVLYRAYTKEGRDKRMEGIDVGLFTQNPNNNADVVKLMAERRHAVITTSHKAKLACGTSRLVSPTAVESLYHRTQHVSSVKLPSGTKIDLRA